MPFEPKPNETLSIFGERYTVQPLPSAPHIPYSSEGGRAFVYQLKDQKGGYFALKVFKRKYRSPHLVNTTQQLRHLESFEGLRAAHRRVIPPDAAVAEKFPDLQYAMLMPWISGSTWYDVLIKARDHGSYVNLPFAIKLCAQFLKVMAALEQKGYAHADISQGNLMVGQQQPEVQLLDLEDMYLPGAPAPAQDYKGTPGYRHRSGDQGATTWCGEGDRYAAAVVAAEMLVLTNQAAARLATDTGYFTSHCQDAVGKERFEFAQGLLARTAPEFARLFRQAWFSDSLSACPKIADLRGALEQTAARTEKLNTAPLPQGQGFKWSTWDAHQEAPPTPAPAAPAPPRRPPASVPSGMWSSAPPPTPPPAPPVRPPPFTAAATPTNSSNAVKGWLIVVAIIALLVLVIYLSSRSAPRASNNFAPPTATQFSQATPPVVVPTEAPSVASPTPEATIAAASEAEPSTEETLTVNALDGVWQFTVNNLDALLTIRNGVGQFVTATPYAIDQTVTESDKLQAQRGIILEGNNPVLAGTQISPSTYTPDEILIQRQPNGTFKAWDRDNVNVKDWEELPIKSFKPDFTGGPREGEFLTAEDIAGVWQFSNFSRKNYPAELVFRAGRGIFRTRTTLDVTQQARAEINELGILVRCSQPMLRVDAIKAPDFSPDKLLFQRQTDGSFKVWLRDDVSIKDWIPVTVKSHQAP